MGSHQPSSTVVVVVDGYMTRWWLYTTAHIVLVNGMVTLVQISLYLQVELYSLLNVCIPRSNIRMRQSQEMWMV